MIPMTPEQTIEIVNDALAFTRAADRAGISEADARRLCAALGELPASQVHRICAAALEQRRTSETRMRRRRSR
jgi:hypothetical protein